ncbi:MAG: NAD kinase [Prolixibacteraceae bacterium]
MRIAVYGTEVREEFLPIYKRIFYFFEQHNIELLLHEQIDYFLNSVYQIDTNNAAVFGKIISPQSPIDFVLSIGGDGTFLNAISYALSLGIPIAGINCGRLGFLADISSENLEEALLQLLTGDYKIEHRTLLEIIEPKSIMSGFKYAANELTVQKLDNSSMIKIDSFINQEFLASYWADGLIVGTPTGSTAYSLSVGGPIMTPDLAGMIITPIATHNLTVRPVVIPDNVEVELRIEGRGTHFLVSIDHHSEPVEFSTILKIRKAKVTYPVVKLNGLSFYSTLRNKLMWGADKRN